MNTIICTNGFGKKILIQLSDRFPITAEGLSDDDPQGQSPYGIKSLVRIPVNGDDDNVVLEYKVRESPAEIQRQIRDIK